MAEKASFQETLEGDTPADHLCLVFLALLLTAACFARFSSLRESPSIVFWNEITMSQDIPDMFKILVASDIHIGYNEKDSIRGEDSFNAFEEVMQIARDRQVDFVLLGGDLFHDNKPSPKCMFFATETLRKYCLGESNVAFELISDQKENFKHTTNFPYVNFEEENLNVALPVFSIHGNHDDPTGKNPMCYLETLAASGLINYFGKYMDMKKIDVRPLLLRKGRTNLALYGLGSLPEERLHRLFEKKAVRFLRPAEDTENWFNVFVVHQNRSPHGTKYLPEKFLTQLPHLVVWGHEHESKPEPDFNQDCGFHVLQPGSTVTTALCESESIPKNVFIVEIFYDEEAGDNKFKTEAIPLETVRQFYFESMDLDQELADHDIKNVKENKEAIQRVVADKVQSMIAQAEIDRRERQPKLPLIRLRLESQNVIPFHEKTFGIAFQGKVANPNDIILFKRKIVKKTANKGDIDRSVLDSLIAEFDGSQISNIEDLVVEYFESKKDAKSQLNVLPERHLTLKVKDMVEKEMDGSAITEFIERLQEKCAAKLLDKIDIDSIGDEAELKNYIRDFRANIVSKDKHREEAFSHAVSQASKSQSSNGSKYSDVIS